MAPDWTVLRLEPSAPWAETEKKAMQKEAEEDHARNRAAYDLAALQPEGPGLYVCPGCGSVSRGVHANTCGGGFAPR
jgi:hypothetical protein